MDLAFKELEEFFFDENAPPAAMSGLQCGHVNHPKYNTVTDVGTGTCVQNNPITSSGSNINSSAFNEIWETFCQEQSQNHTPFPLNMNSSGHSDNRNQISNPIIGSAPIDNRSLADTRSQHPYKYQMMMHLPDSPPDSGSEPYSPPQDLGCDKDGFEDPRLIDHVRQYPRDNISKWPTCNQKATNPEQWPYNTTLQQYFPPEITDPIKHNYVQNSHRRVPSSSSLKSLLGNGRPQQNENAIHLDHKSYREPIIPRKVPVPQHIVPLTKSNMPSIICGKSNVQNGISPVRTAKTQTQIKARIYPLLNDQLDYGIDKGFQNPNNNGGDNKKGDDATKFPKIHAESTGTTTIQTRDEDMVIGTLGKKRKMAEDECKPLYHNHGIERVNLRENDGLHIINSPLVLNVNLEKTPLKVNSFKDRITPQPIKCNNLNLNRISEQIHNNSFNKIHPNPPPSITNGSTVTLPPATNQISESGGYQCIQWHPFQPSAWCSLYAQDLSPLMSPSFTVLADKGFNFSTVDESFVCQKKNHFQVTLDMCLHGDPKYIKGADGTFKPIESFVALFYGVKAESTSQVIRIEQSQSDRSKRSFQPVLLPLVPGKPFKWTIGRLHFSETTTNNMRKKGKPNPDQRYFMLIVALGARVKKCHGTNSGAPLPTDPAKTFNLPQNFYQHCSHVNHPPIRAPTSSETEDFGMEGIDNQALTIEHDDHLYEDVIMIAFASEKIIVRASNPGQFDNDPDLTWQRGQGIDSICHMGQVGINTDNPDESLVVQGNIKLTGHILQPSDIRIKTNITELDSRQQLKNVSKIKVYHYRYDPSKLGFPGREGDTLSDTGVLAQEIEKVIPEAVKKTAFWQTPGGEIIQDFLIVNKERIFMENVGAVKELTKLTGTLGSRIEKLEKLNKALPKCHRTNSFKSLSGLSNSMSYTSSIMIRSTSSKLSSTITPCRSNMASDIYNKFGTITPENTRSRSLKQACKRMVSNKLLQCSCAFITLIMGFCLITMSTLFVLEYMHRHKKLNESRKEFPEGTILADPIPPYYRPSSLAASKGELPSFQEIRQKYPASSGKYSKDPSDKIPEQVGLYGNPSIGSDKGVTPTAVKVTLQTIPTFSISYENRYTKWGLQGTTPGRNLKKLPVTFNIVKRLKTNSPTFSTSNELIPSASLTFTSTSILHWSTNQSTPNKPYSPTLPPYIGLFRAPNLGEMAKGLDIFGQNAQYQTGAATYKLTPLPIPIHISACFKKHHAVCPTYCCDNSSTTFYFKPGKVPKFLVGLSRYVTKPALPLIPPNQETPPFMTKSQASSPTLLQSQFRSADQRSEAQFDIDDIDEHLTLDDDTSTIDYDHNERDIATDKKPFIKTLIKISKDPPSASTTNNGLSPSLSNTKLFDKFPSTMTPKQALDVKLTRQPTLDMVDSNALNFSADDYTTTQGTEFPTNPVTPLVLQPRNSNQPIHTLTLKKLGGADSKIITLTMLRHDGPSAKVVQMKKVQAVKSSPHILHHPSKPIKGQFFYGAAVGSDRAGALVHEEDGEKWIRLKRSSSNFKNVNYYERRNGVEENVSLGRNRRTRDVGIDDGLTIRAIKLLELEQTLKCAPERSELGLGKNRNRSEKEIVKAESTLYSAECHGLADQAFSFSIPLAFPFIPITLDFKLDDNAILVLCDHYFSHMPCRQQSYLPILADDLQESKNRWRLPVGQYFWSSYKFRVARKNTFYKPLEICTWSDKYIGKTFSQSNLYFQRIPCHT